MKPSDAKRQMLQTFIKSCDNISKEFRKTGHWIELFNALNVDVIISLESSGMNKEAEFWRATDSLNRPTNNDKIRVENYLNARKAMLLGFVSKL